VDTGIVADVLEVNAAYIIVVKVGLIPECHLVPPSSSETWCPLYFSTWQTASWVEPRYRFTGLTLEDISRRIVIPIGRSKEHCSAGVD
jgi:hypothetical protein